MSAVRIPAGLRIARGYSVRDNAGALRSIKTGKVRDTVGILRSFFGMLSATVSPNPVATSTSSSAPIDITTPPTTVTVTGGTPPYTGSWALVGTPPDTWTINSPASLSTSFTASQVTGAPAYTAIASFAFSGSDGAGSSFVSPTVTARARNGYNVSPSGGGVLP